MMSEGLPGLGPAGLLVPTGLATPSVGVEAGLVLGAVAGVEGTAEATAEGAALAAALAEGAALAALEALTEGSLDAAGPGDTSGGLSALVGWGAPAPAGSVFAGEVVGLAPSLEGEGLESRARAPNARPPSTAAAASSLSTRPRGELVTGTSTGSSSIEGGGCLLSEKA